MKQPISKLFTDKMLNEAEGMSHREMVDKLVKPEMERINEATGQENNVDFIAYLLEFVVNEAKIQKASV